MTNMNPDADFGSGPHFSATPKYVIGYGSSRLKIVDQYSLAQLFDKYHASLWEEGSHKYNVTSFIMEIHLILHGSKFSVLSQEMLDNIIESLRIRGNSNATINRKVAALSKLLRKAHKMGDIHSLPEFRRQKERAGRIRFLEREEEAALFSAIRARSEDAWRLSVFLVDTGCRLGEGIGLIWNDIQGGRASFWITKSGRSRTVPLTLRAQEVVDIPRGRLKGPFSMLQQVRFRAIWNEAKAEVGLGADSQVVPHILRHTCASRLVQGGIDMRRIQMWLGHQTLPMTMRYAHLATNDLDSCVVVLENPPRRPGDAAANADGAAAAPMADAADAGRDAADENSFPATAAEG